MKQKVEAFLLVMSLSLVVPSALAANGGSPENPKQPPEQSQVRDRDIYGHQMMTPEERNEYRVKMHSAKTFEEREKIRREHHEQMVARAKERGITLPAEPPARGGGRQGMGGPGPGGGAGKRGLDSERGQGPRY